MVVWCTVEDGDKDKNDDKGGDVICVDDNDHSIVGGDGNSGEGNDEYKKGMFCLFHICINT